MHFEDALNEYMYHCRAKGFTEKTMINKHQEYKQFQRYMKEKRGIKYLESISVHDMKSYVRYKQNQGLKPQSIVSMTKMIKAFFNWCVKEEYIKESPLNKVEIPKVPKKVIRGVTRSEVYDMINAFPMKGGYIDLRNRAIICMMCDTGLRSMEIRKLTTSNVRENSILVNGKGQKERVLAISPYLKKVLIRYERIKKEYFEDKLVKCENYFLNYLGDELTHVGLYNIIKTAAKKAGIKGRVHPHALRHFYTVESLKTGKLSLYEISRLLGHSSIAITQIYLASMTDEDLLNKASASSPLMNMK